MTEISGSDTGTRRGPTGLGGWLILPIIGFAGTMALTVINLVQLDTGGLAAIVTATSGPLAALKIPTLLSLVLGCVVVMSAAFCLFLVFARKRAIVKFATAHFVLLVAAAFADGWLDEVLRSHDPAVVSNEVRTVLIAAIWIPYFQISRRVRNTFVNGRERVAIAKVFE